jgi:hypothetical protein
VGQIPPQKTREQREQELRAMFKSTAGQPAVFRLFLASFPPGVVPARGTPVVETILDREYGPPSGPLARPNHEGGQPTTITFST